MIAEDTLLACVVKDSVKINLLLGYISIPCPTKWFYQDRTSLMYNYCPLSLMKSNLILFPLMKPDWVSLFYIHSILVTEQISKWLVDSLQESKEDWLLTAFLVARQAGGEGQHLFPSYQRWFSETFGDLSTSPASSGRKFVFLVDTLLSLIQHESLPTLKVLFEAFMEVDLWRSKKRKNQLL
jgi:hypothetical protein